MFPWNENIKKIFVTYPLALGCIICSLAKGEEREREREREIITIFMTWELVN